MVTDTVNHDKPGGGHDLLMPSVLSLIHILSEELLGEFQTEVVDMFVKEPERSYTVEDAAAGTK